MVLLELLAATLPADLMARRAARLAAHFAWSQYLDAHEALYRRLAGFDDCQVVRLAEHR